MPRDPNLMPDFSKENQYEFECGVCGKNFLGHKGHCVCDGCKANDYARVPRNRFSFRDTKPGSGTVYEWEVIDLLRGVVDRTHTKEHARRIASDMQERWERDLSTAATLK